LKPPDWIARAGALGDASSPDHYDDVWKRYDGDVIVESIKSLTPNNIAQNAQAVIDLFNHGPELLQQAAAALSKAQDVLELLSAAERHFVEGDIGNARTHTARAASVLEAALNEPRPPDQPPAALAA